jgi:hypothetical protein
MGQKELILPPDLSALSQNLHKQSRQWFIFQSVWLWGLNLIIQISPFSILIHES